MSISKTEDTFSEMYERDPEATYRLVCELLDVQFAVSEAYRRFQDKRDS